MGDSRLIDAKQRAIISVLQPHFDAAGRPAGSKPVICAEPSPDALQATAAALAGSGGASNGQAEAFASLAANSGESAGSIGLRTQSIQLLRDAYYRICEGYLSGALDETSFDIMQRRFQNHMIALLAVEQLTGATKAPAVTLEASGSADAGANATQLSGQINRAEEQLARLESLRSDLQTRHDSDDTSDDAKKTLKAQIDRLDGRIDRQKELIATLTEAFTAALSDTTEASTQTGSSVAAEALARAELPGHVSQAVEKITLAALNQNYAAQLCFAELRIRKLEDKEKIGSVMLEHCRGLLQEVVNQQQQLGYAQAQRVTIIKNIVSLVGQGKLTGDQAAAMLSVVDNAVGGISPIQPARPSVNNSG